MSFGGIVAYLGQGGNAPDYWALTFLL